MKASSLGGGVHHPWPLPGGGKNQKWRSRELIRCVPEKSKVRILILYMENTIILMESTVNKAKVNNGCYNMQITPPCAYPAWGDVFRRRYRPGTLPQAAASSDC